MSSVDQRIVEMNFKGDSFLSGVKNALSSLLSLKNGLNGLKGSESELNNLDAAGKKFSLKNIADSLTGLSSKFSSLSVVGITALANITNKAVNAGLTLVKSLTLDPITAGFQKYELGINATQRIIANTGASLKVVTAALNDLNTYSNQTIYNFEQMTQAIGQFTAAGIPLKSATADIKGMSNAAALTGASMDSLQSAFYQMSQAMAGGVIKLQDWNSLQNAGVADGKEFQKAFEETAASMGHNVDEIVAKQGGFRNSLQKGWLTADVFSKAMGVMAGSLNTTTGQTEAYSVAQLKAMGYTESQAVSLHKLSAAALDTATKTRSFSQLLDNLKDDASTAWAHVFQAIIGNLPQATSEFTKLSSVAQNIFLGPVNNLAAFIDEWNKLGGRAALIDAVVSAFKDLSKILGTIKAAFDEVFPSTGGGATNGFVSLTKSLDSFVQKLTPTKATLNDIKDVFVAVFSVIKLGITIVGDLFGAFTHVGSSASSAGGGFLSLVASIANFVTRVTDAIRSGNALADVFKVIGTVLQIPIRAISALIGALTGGGAGGAAGGAVSAVSGFVSKVGDAFKGLADAIVNGIKNGDLSKIGSILNQLLLGGVLISIRKFFAGLGSGSGEGGGLFSTIKESFESLTTTLKNMQTSLKSDILLKIAAAVALLTASLVALSFINVGNLAKALGAMTIMFTELLGALAVVARIAGSAGIVKMTVIGVALNELATAILILTAAVAILSLFSWEGLAKGLSAIAILLGELVVATTLLSADSKGLITSAIAMNIMAVALNTLALAVRQLGGLDFGTLAKGIGSIAALLLIVTAFNAISGGGKNLVSTAAAMVLIGAAMNVMAIAVAKLGALSLGTLAKGIGSIAATLLILVVAMNAMDGALPGAAALVVAAAALLILSKALNSMGAETWGQIGKALVLLAGSLVIIAAAMILMTEALPGAAALLVVSAALAILTPILIALGNLGWQQIVTGLLALAGVFVVIGAAGLLLTPLIPSLLLLGVAIALLGVGVLAIGGGLALFAVGLTALGVALAASGAGILAFVKSMLALIPATLTAIGNGIVAFAQAIGNGASSLVNAFVQIVTAIANGLVKAVPAMGKAIGAIITAVLNAINQNGPKIITTFLNLILDIITKLATYYPKFVAAGVQLVTNTINGVAQKVPGMVSAAANLIIAFINSIGSNTVKVVAAAGKMVISMINGIANTIRAQTPAMDSAMRNLGSAMIQALVSAITSGAGAILSAIGGVVSGAVSWAKHLLGISSPSKVFLAIGAFAMMGWALGHTQNAHLVIDSLTAVGTAAIEALKSTMSGLNDEVNSNLNLQPVITPVIDLTEVRKGFTQVNTLSKSQLIAATASTTSAASISAASAAAQAQAGIPGAGGTTLLFNQYNTSPEALSAIDIYRRTKNQISIAKGVLSGNANTG